MSWAAVATTVGAVGGALIGKSKAPKAVPTKEVDVGKVTQDTIAANTAALPGAKNLSGSVNTFNQGEATRLLNQALPGFDKLQATLTSKIQQDLDNEGQLGSEQIAQIEQFAAERGIKRGTSGGFNDLSLVRDFGFSAIDAKQMDRTRALNSVQQLLGITPNVSPTSPMFAFTDPNSNINAQFRNNENAQATAQSAANAKASASNANRSMWAGAFGTTAGAVGDYFKNRKSGDKKQEETKETYTLPYV